MTPHLTEDQLDALLSATSDTVPGPTRLHIAECTGCRHELSTIEQSLTNFRLAATQFALLETPSRPALITSTARGSFALPKFIWAAGLASILAVSALTISNVHKTTPVLPSITTARTVEPVSDDALLKDIDSDLSNSVPPSLQPLDTPATAGELTSTSN